MRDGERIVLDLGSEFSGYATDITRSYPVNGKFTDDQKAIHNAVLSAQQAVINAMKPGISWVDMHLLAEKTIIEHLLKIGILHNGTVKEIQEAYVGSVFFCHGLGHLLGLNVHDVGGYPAGVERSKIPGPAWLRTARKLEAGMVITVEPGIYFNNLVIDKALKDEKKAKYINAETLKRFRESGGVRIEDDILVTDTGAENFTLVPTTVEDIEQVIREARGGKSRSGNRGTCFVGCNE
jgi:Xaa-Pro dipeptidase